MTRQAYSSACLPARKAFLVQLCSQAMLERQPYHKRCALKPYSSSNIITETSVQELWRYSYPHHKDSVPSWSVPIIALCSPIAVMAVYSQIWRASRLEVHNAILGGLSCVIFTALVTNLIKLAVSACCMLLGDCMIEVSLVGLA